MFVQGDLFEADFRDATVVTLYLLTSLNLKLRPKLLDMRPGTRVVSHVFRMGDWEPDETAKIGASEVYLWVVPAKVAGRWRVTSATAPRSSSRSSSTTSGSRARCWPGTRRSGCRACASAAARSASRRRGRRRRAGARGRVAGDRIEGADGAWSAVRLKPN